MTPRSSLTIESLKLRCFVIILFAAISVSCSNAISLNEDKNLGTGTRSDEERQEIIGRWSATLNKFREEDRLSRRERSCILFVGSSTIRMWADFYSDSRGLDALNRGFGGSTMADLEALADELVYRYRPEIVVIYQGDNDLAYGAPLTEFTEPLMRFTATLKSRLPRSKLVLIAIKPSPTRSHRWPIYNRANNWLRDNAKRNGWIYVNANSGLLSEEGLINAQYYADDGVHFNEDGYNLWAKNLMTAIESNAQASAICPKVDPE